MENFFKNLNYKNVIFAFMLILFLVLVFIWKDVAIMFFASFVIASSLIPIVDKLENKMPRAVASTVVLFLLLSLIFAVFIPVFIVSAEEIKTFAISFPEYVDTLDDYLLSSPLLSKFNFSPIDLDAIASSASTSSADIINYILDFGRNIGSAVVYFVVSIIIIFNMLIDKTKLKNFYLSLFPSAFQDKAEQIGCIISSKLGGYLIALIATMASVGVMMLIGLSLFKINYAIILSLITGVLDIIPVIGPGLALIICIIMTYKFGMGAVGAVLVVFTVAQLIENNFVRPYVFGKFLDLHPLIIFLFLFIVAKSMGLVGMIFAPAVAVLVTVLFEELYLKNIK